jgi:ADP-ribose pyrophosphatase YjhB (NUDIX family)
MVTMLTGERIARNANLRLSCTAAVLDGGKVLVARRAEDGCWCFPGGGIDAGESVKEACEREVFEETGLVVAVNKLIAVTSDPHRVFEYPDGNRWHTIDLLFSAVVLHGVLSTGREVTAAGFFDRHQVKELDLLECHRELMDDVFADRKDTIIR